MTSENTRNANCAPTLRGRNGARAGVPAPLRPQLDRGKFFIFLLLMVVGGLPGPGRAAAQEVKPSAYGEMRWRSIGPYRSGNVFAVAGVPGDPAVYYIGLPEGGVWKTSDGGTLWKPIFDAEHVPSIGAVAASPSNPAVVYVGTGDASIWSFTPGRGMYKSTDGGETWTHIGLEKTLYINAVVVDPRNPNIVLVGALGSREFFGGGANAARGVYRSTDGGRTWKQVLFKDAYTGVADMSWDYFDPRVVYATFERSLFGLSPAEQKKLPPQGAILYKSTDEGKTWKPLSGEGLPENVTTFEIAVASGTHGRRVYAEAQSHGRDAQGVYRSDDGGKSWQLGTKEIGSAGGHIYADPKNPDVVYLMGTSMYRSTDGARSFVSYKGAPGGDDDRDLWIDPENPRRMLMGVDQGPTITVDGGKTWTPWYNLPNGQFYNVFTDNHFPYRVCGAQQDSGTACVLSRSDYGEIRESDWSPIGGFENGYIVPDPLNPRYVFTQGWYHVLRRYDRRTGQVAVLFSPAPKDRFTGAPPMAFSPQDSHVLYMGAQYVMESTDGGRDWRHISPDLTERPQPKKTGNGSMPFFARRGAAIESLAPSPVSAGEIWAGTNNGLIQLTRDGGKTWQNVTPAGLPERGGVTFIDASHHAAGTAYAAVSVFGDDQPYLYRTSDYGRSWQKIVSGLADDVKARVVREDPVDANLLYSGTEMGAYVSFDRGDHWQSLQLNLPNTVVSDIDVHGDDLAISTYGRSLWILDDVTPLRQTQAAEATDAEAYLYKPESAWRVRWDNDQDTPLPPEVPAGQNPPEGAIIDYYLKTPAKGTITLGIYDGHGNLVREYSSIAPKPEASMPNVPTYWFRAPVVLPTTAGMHRIAWDLRYPIPPALTYSYFGNLLDYTEYTLTWHAIKGETPRTQPVGPIVVPGTYQVRLGVDGKTYTRELTIKNDPRMSVPQDALEAQLEFEQRMMAGMTVSYDSFQQIDQLLATLAADEAKVKGKPDAAKVIAAADAVKKKVSELANGRVHSFGLANRDLARHLEDMEFGDLRPTASDLAAGEADCKDIDTALASFAQLREKDLPALNGELAQAHLDPVALPVPAADPDCHVGGGASR
jgi:photosystem II stability/assembly factor-like uncharacterized protein